jgi:hypothetical protein
MKPKLYNINVRDRFVATTVGTCMFHLVYFLKTSKFCTGAFIYLTVPKGSIKHDENNICIKQLQAYTIVEIRSYLQEIRLPV